VLVLAPDPPPPPPPPAPEKIAAIFGVRQTGHGILFVQPGDPASTIAIAGDFNGWSGSATPLAYNAQLGVHEAIVPIAPGSYQYRVVTDGRWVADQYNPHSTLNDYGEPNSVLDVQARTGA
jgi:hypothetical protein